MAKKIRYNKLIITANALVPKGAVMERAIFKELKNFQELTNIVKEDQTQTMYSIWYPLNKEDAHGCLVEDQKVLEDACIEYMKNGEKNLKMLHNGNVIQAAVVKELWIVKAGDPIFKNPDLVGSIAGGIKFFDKELYDKMKNENWETSIEGTAEEEIIEKSLFSKIETFVTELVQKIINKNIEKAGVMTPEEIAKIIDEKLTAFRQECDSKYAPMKTEEPETEVEAGCGTDELKKEIESLKAELKKSNTDIDGIKKELGNSKQGKEQPAKKEIAKDTKVYGVFGSYDK